MIFYPSVAQDPAEAVRLYTRAGQTGYYELACCHLEGTGVEKNAAEAVRLLRLISDDRRAQLKLGRCLAAGEGVAKDAAAAARLYELAVAQGSADAMNNLGVCYEGGTGVEQDYIRAVELYRRAADLGNAPARANLGTCYEYGRGVAQVSKNKQQIGSKK